MLVSGISFNSNNNAVSKQKKAPAFRANLGFEQDALDFSKTCISKITKNCNQEAQRYYLEGSNLKPETIVNDVINGFTNLFEKVTEGIKDYSIKFVRNEENKRFLDAHITTPSGKIIKAENIISPSLDFLPNKHFDNGEPFSAAVTQFVGEVNTAVADSGKGFKAGNPFNELYDKLYFARSEYREANHKF